ncbi:MAG: hypothetical protein QM775_23345 [Pirellulales bacterium]
MGCALAESGRNGCSDGTAQNACCCGSRACTIVTSVASHEGRKQCFVGAYDKVSPDGIRAKD